MIAPGLLGWGLGSALAGPLGLGDLHAPLDTPFVSAESCRDCHASIVEDWHGSRHRASWTNAIFFEGYLDEPEPFCVYCHAPLAEQAAEVLANQRWYLARASPGSIVASVPLQPEPSAAEGVTCAVCHLREGRIVSTFASGAHRSRIEPALADGELCASCHEFPFPVFTPSATLLTDALMQSTASEWRAWRQAGGDRSCQDCHMPAGRHVFRGAHDLAFLRDSVRVEARAVEQGVRFELRSVGVGHQLPTGDLFRHLTLEVDRGDGFTSIHRIGRTFRTWIDPQLGVVRKGPAGDTRLRPGEPRVVTTDAALRWRLRYHYGSERDEARGRNPEDVLVVTLHEGSLAQGR